MRLNKLNRDDRNSFISAQFNQWNSCFYGSVKLRRAPFEGQMLFSIEFFKIMSKCVVRKKTIMKYFTFSSESMQSMCFAFWIEKLEWIKHFSTIFRCMKMHQECDKQIQEKYIFLISVLEACFLCICVSIYCTVIKSAQAQKSTTHFNCIQNIHFIEIITCTNVQLHKSY